MKKLFLASSVHFVAKNIAKHFNKKRLKLVFITTPVEPKQNGLHNLQWFIKDRKSLVSAGFIVTDYTITGKTKNEIKKDLKPYDIIYISGGDAFYMLHKIQQTGCADILRKYIEKGKIYMGSSAGSVIAGLDIGPIRRPETAGKIPSLKNYRGLGLVDFVTLPHWGETNHRDKYFSGRLEQTYNEDNKVILLTNNQYIIVEDDKYRIIDIKKDRF